ncbi:MAG: restriction endonuclease [Bacteroidetes bacterium]|jgi:type I restriction enzyme, S subunit|nr:restriction endonuclease [Bacteroidota bacterium]
MNTYTISNTKLNPNRVFILQKSELEKRLDPEYYGHIYNEYDKKLRLKPFKKFSHIIKSINNGFDFRDYKDNGTPYLKVANIRKGEFRFDKIQYIDFNSSEISKNIQLKKGNLLLTRKGTFGYAIALEKDYDFVISSEVFYIELLDNTINPKFLEIFFNSEIGQAQFDKNKIGAIMGSLSQEAIRDLKIPFPAQEIQNKVIELYSNYIQQKKRNEAEAKKLLSSIDDYLLGELGINLPEPPENTLDNRMFTVSLKEISGGRFDPKLYDNNTQAIRNAIKGTAFNKVKLKELVAHSVAGDWGKDEKVELVDYKRCLVIRATEFDNLYNLNLDNSRVKYRLINSDKLEKIDIQVNDLLIEKSGGSPDQPVGRISIITKNILKTHQIGYSNFIHKIRVDNLKINSEYLFCFLKTVHNIKLTDAMQSQTNGIRNLIMSNYFNQIIPLPKIEKQKEIAEHISEIREQAQKLKDKTEEALKEASKEIEQILLN